MDYPAIGCACLVALVFALSAWSKVRGRAAFREFAAATRVLAGSVRARGISDSVARTTALVVVVAEAATALLVAVPYTARAGFALAVVLLTGFSVAIAASLRRGVSTSCRCFGASSAPLSGRHLVRNGVLLAASVAGLVTAGGQLGSPHPGGIAIAAVAALVVAVLLTRIDDLAELFAPPAADGRGAQRGKHDALSRRRSGPGGSAVPAEPAPDVRRHPPAQGAHGTAREGSQRRS
ncbi:MauE/DoxX family redox-associated membrane protein [Nonomuraea cavernae]|uniref:MauE/DoxX family redox-associated membrane protein n=1 Tax=Nonomuraea cavernae TaxID=2045107 RepID=UPI00188A9FF1|nr:MauE/DoxX family redox-associated membrane protein [Nonomuraea cavernae]MCA2185644.1 hypothetical protein [Nonomuraea cavernae]